MTEYETALHITQSLYSQMNMNTARKVVQLNWGASVAQFFFITANIQGLFVPTIVTSFCQMFRCDGVSILMYFTRPSLQSSSFKVYTVSKPNTPQLSRLTDDMYDQIFSWAVCRWYRDHNQHFPNGFDYQRLHPEFKTMEKAGFDEKHTVEHNCDMIPIFLGTLLADDLNTL